MKTNRPLTARRNPGSSRAGFTLLELLIVASILIAVSFVAMSNFKDALETADEGVVRTEMLEIARAIRQFKADTGYYPKTGPFALEDDGGHVSGSSLRNTYSVESGDGAAWFYSPANFYQLLSTKSPLDGTGHALESWDATTARGWRGPYLQGLERGRLAVGDGINGSDESFIANPNVAGDLSGYPDEGSVVSGVWGIADPFELASDSSLVWSLYDGESCDGAYGFPYLLFYDSDESAFVLISAGEDGFFQSADDLEVLVK